MRAKYIVQVVFLFVFANSNAQIGTKGIYDLFYISVKRQIEKLPNGEHKLHFKNNQLKSVFTLKNGKLHGNTKEYYENGQLKFEGQYQNGKREGNHREYYKNGSLESEYEFRER